MNKRTVTVIKNFANGLLVVCQIIRYDDEED